MFQKLKALSCLFWISDPPDLTEEEQLELQSLEANGEDHFKAWSEAAANDAGGQQDEEVHDHVNVASFGVRLGMHK